MSKPMIIVDIQLDDRGDHWAGWIEGVGAYVYADTVDGLAHQARVALDALFASFTSDADLYAYMLARGLRYQDQVSDPPPLRLAVSKELATA